MINIKLLDINTKQTNEILRLINGIDSPEIYSDVVNCIEQCYHKPNEIELIMCALNQVLEGHGTEAIRGEWLDNYHCDVIAMYVNMGDTYTNTIIRDLVKNMWIVSSYDDFVDDFVESQNAY